MTITEKDIDGLAELARLEIPAEEKSAFVKDFERILEYVDQIKAVSVEGLVPAPAAVKNVMRKDEHPVESGMHTEALLAEAPEAKDGFVKVQKIL